MGTGSFQEIESGRGVKLTPHPSSAKVNKNSRAIPVLSLRAFVAYDRVKRTYSYLICLYYSKDYCHRVTTQLQLVIIIIIIIPWDVA
jgi:hypothetical protein